MIMKTTWQATVSAVRLGLRRIIEPQVLFPAFAVLFSGALWWITLNLVAIERDAAEEAARASVRELTETYEAQVVRVLREIDRDLKMVQYAYGKSGAQGALAELENKDLLPPAFLFTVGILDTQARLVVSTRTPDVIFAPADYLNNHRQGELRISPPLQSPDSDEWKLQFSRGLIGANGDFEGIVIIAVDAAFFVSGYESSRLGDHGLIGMPGTDGIFRVRRTGTSIEAGDAVDYAALVPDADMEETWVTLLSTPWDGVQRYIGVRQLFEFPLAVMVGLSKEEQLAEAVQNSRLYLFRSAFGNAVFILVIGLLWRMSHKLEESRRREVESRIAHAEQVEYLAYHDSLTGLPNRSLFSKLLGQSIHMAQRHDRKLAVLFLDLDRFKHINDSLGHEAGDRLLQEVAVRLKHCLRESDVVARLGGDEFVVMLPELTDEAYVSTVARKMIGAIGKPFTLSDQEFRVTVSIGISAYPRDGLDEQTLTKSADVAMYHAKENGKNNFQFYSEKLHKESLQRLTLESSLQHALELDEFLLHYQAKRDVKTGRVTGMEALLRWQHPDLGMIPPMQFIPLAEEAGLMPAIGRWVLKTACEQNVAWQKEGLPPMSMAVNLSAQQFFDPTLPEDIATALQQTGMEAGQLELEITEGLLMQDVHRALKVLNQLKEIGVRIAIDDFGVGYSSLAMLKQFPLDTIKIDRAFIRDITQIDENKTLTDAIVAMGHMLSLTVVAQGVETKEQADYLRDHACDELQGFYFNKPVPPEEFTALLRGQPGPPGTT